MTQERTTRWDAGAERYDTWLIDASDGKLGRSAAEINAWRLIWRQVLGPPPCRVLDVGTGTGAVGLLLSYLGYEVTGIDSSEAMLAVARRKAEAAELAIEFRHGPAEALPFDDDAFDAVVSRLLMQLLPEPLVAVREWCRCVRQGGIAAAVLLDYRRLGAIANLRNRAIDAARRGGAKEDREAKITRDAQLPLWQAPKRSFANVFIRAGLEQVLVDELVGVDLLESRRVRNRTRAWVPHFLLQGTVR